VIEPLFPARDLRTGGRRYDNRAVLDAIFYLLRSGCQGRMIPHALVPWWVAYRWYRTWTGEGTWDKVHDALRAQVRAAAGRPHPTAAILDSQTLKSSEGGQAIGFDPAKRTTGRKRHLLCDMLGLLLVVMVTAARVQDRPGGRAILTRLAATFRTVALVWADGGYATIDEGLLSWAKDQLEIVIEIVRRTEGIKSDRG
jgi:transposase